MTDLGTGYRALLIPVEGPLEEIRLDGTLEQLQKAVGGHIEAVPIPRPFDPEGKATAYVNEEGKFDATNCNVNWRATDFMVPGFGIRPRDYIAGPMLLCGFDIRTGDHIDLPETVIRRARLIESEAA